MGIPGFGLHSPQIKFHARGWVAEKKKDNRATQLTRKRDSGHNTVFANLNKNGSGEFDKGFESAINMLSNEQ